jgi:hypothetical protein
VTDISKRVDQAAERLLAADASALSVVFDQIISDFIGPNFIAKRAMMVDRTGNSSKPSTVIYRADVGESPTTESVAADQAAAIIEVYDELDINTFRDAYLRIASAKLLKKTGIPRGETRTNITLGIIFARRSSVPLDRFADELFYLNSERSHGEWLDMFVIASVGVINCAVQFPGETLSGDFLPPLEGALAVSPPAFYVVIVMRPAGSRSFKKMLAFLIGHLVFFAPDIANRLPNWSDLLEGVPKEVITHSGFQANLSGQLVPVPPEDYAGRSIPTIPATIEDSTGDVLSTIEYRKWQDGGIILLTGKLPLDGLLIFLPNVRPEYLRVIKRPQLQISPLLPLTRGQFDEFLKSIEGRSNLRVNTQPPQGFVIQKIMDEGTSTPFIARCTLGLLRIRENVLRAGSERDAFDKIFQSTLSSVTSARSACREIERLWTDHAQRVASGEIAKINGGNIQILESVDKKLGTEFETFLNASARAIKTGVQGLGSQLGVDIGFLFKKEAAFKSGIERLRKVDPALADYLEECRSWTERLLLMRNDLEHELWNLPRVTYAIQNGTVAANEPKIEGEPVSQVTKFLFDRLSCFFEEMIAHMLQRKLPEGMTLTELSRTSRTPAAPERFRITLATGGEAPWKIKYHNDKFDDV